jgi:hypothetical protein
MPNCPLIEQQLPLYSPALRFVAFCWDFTKRSIALSTGTDALKKMIVLLFFFWSFMSFHLFSDDNILHISGLTCMVLRNVVFSGIN